MLEEVQVDRNLDHHRSRRAASGDGAGAPDGAVESLAFGHPDRRLGHRPGHHQLVDVVELEGASRVLPDPAAQHQHGHPVEVRLRDAGEGVR